MDEWQQAVSCSSFKWPVGMFWLCYVGHQICINSCTFPLSPFLWLAAFSYVILVSQYYVLVLGVSVFLEISSFQDARLWWESFNVRSVNSEKEPWMIIIFSQTTGKSVVCIILALYSDVISRRNVIKKIVICLEMLCCVFFCLVSVLRGTSVDLRNVNTTLHTHTSITHLSFSTTWYFRYLSFRKYLKLWFMKSFNLYHPCHTFGTQLWREWPLYMNNDN